MPSTDRPHIRPHIRPRPARLALSLSDPDSSGLIDITDLRAEPLPLSLVSAGLTSTPPPPVAPAPEPRERPWPLYVLGSAVALTAALVGMVAAVQPSPTIVVERKAPIERQLSMQEVEAPAVLTTVEHDEPAPDAESMSADPSSSTLATAESTVPPAPSKATKTKRRRGSTTRATKAKTKTKTKSSSTNKSSSSPSVPIQCVLDPQSCSKTGTPKAPSTAKTSKTSALPEKLSTTQLKKALATTKPAAQRCGPDHGADPGAKVRVKLSIDGATGSVTTATPLGDHVGTALGRCVAKALGRTNFPRFGAARMGTIYSVRL